MRTRVLEISATSPDPATIAIATKALVEGRLVAFPTETVYGLGANALSDSAVSAIFAAKGRPATNPLIVHVADLAAARQLAFGWPPAATLLAEQFWPGPLTMVLTKDSAVPLAVTAGGATVALRIPRHPVALALLQHSRIPLAAPSANRSTWLSPTRAEHVLASLNGRVDLILDAGPTPGGLESTVVDMTLWPPILLRPGLLPADLIEQVLGCTLGWVTPRGGSLSPARSPGQQARHYAPTTPLECRPASAADHVLALAADGARIGWLTLDTDVPPSAVALPSHVRVISLAADPAAYSAGLYAALHDLDQLDLQRIVVTLPPESVAWAAVHDRLRRAAQPPTDES